MSIASFFTLAETTKTNVSSETYEVIVLADPAEGGEVFGGGNYESGTLITIEAYENPGYRFQGWVTQGVLISTNPIIEYYVTEDITLTAMFVGDNYLVTVFASPSPWGTVSGGGYYANGDEATISAIPEPGFQFEFWTKNGAVYSTEPSFSFFVTENVTFFAEFAVKTVEFYDIVALSNPADACPVGGGGSFPLGHIAHVWTSPSCDDGYYSFVNWLEDGYQVSTDLYYSFEVTGPRTLLANFEIYEINTIPTPPDGGTVQGSGNYPPGIEVTLTAIANNGYEFVNWTKNRAVVSTENPYTFITALNDEELVANFKSTQGIEIFGTSAIIVYPNPTSGKLRMENGELRIRDVEIFDLIGRKQMLRQAQQPKTESRKGEEEKGEMVIDISGLSAGVYFLKINTDAGEVVKKVVKM